MPECSGLGKSRDTVEFLSDFSSKDDAVRESGGLAAVSMCAAASSAVPRSPGIHSLL